MGTLSRTQKIILLVLAFLDLAVIGGLAAIVITSSRAPAQAPLPTARPTMRVVATYARPHPADSAKAASVCAKQSHHRQCLRIATLPREYKWGRNSKLGPQTESGALAVQNRTCPLAITASAHSGYLLLTFARGDLAFN